MRIRLIGVALCLMATAGSGAAQAQVADYVMGPGSKLWIDGSSNMSDWTVHASSVSGSLTLNDDGLPATAMVTVTADSIRSEKGKIMDRLMYRALKSGTHPTITYSLSAAESLGGDSLLTKGELRAAGVTRAAPMTVEWLPQDGGAFRVRGSHEVRMTDYGMKPPTAMFGALHTRNEVVVHFDVIFLPSTM